MLLKRILNKEKGYGIAVSFFLILSGFSVKTVKEGLEKCHPKSKEQEDNPGKRENGKARGRRQCNDHVGQNHPGTGSCPGPQVRVYVVFLT